MSKIFLGRELNEFQFTQTHTQQDTRKMYSKPNYDGLKYTAIEFTNVSFEYND